MKIQLLFLFVLAILFSQCDAPEPTSADFLQEPLTSMKGKKVLIVWGGWLGHKPEEYSVRMKEWLEKEGAEVTVSDSLGIYKDSLFMASLDLILPYWTMGKISNEEEKGLLDAIRNGVGIAGCHGGMGDSYRNNVEYQYMVGGQWVSHPGGQVDYSVQIINHTDLVTKDISNFDIKTEQYYMHVDPNVKVLATTAFNGEHNEWIDNAVMPLAWKKYYGEGRVFFLSIGHSPDVFEVPEVWKILTRGIEWAAASKYQEKEEWMSPIYSSKN